MDEQDRFYNETSTRFRQIVASKLGERLHSPEVDDVLLDAYVEIFKAWDSFRGESKRESWAQTILERRIGRHIRTLQMQRRQVAKYFSEYGLDEPDAPLSEITTHSVGFNYGAVEYNLLDFDFIKVHLNLTDNQIDTLKILIHELEVSEAAEKLNCTPGNVYVRVHRLRQILSQVFDDAPRSLDNEE